MKKLLIIASALVAFTSLPLAAQDSISGSASQANNTANQISASGAIASGGSVVMPQPLARQTIVQDGTATLKTAPSLGSLALGGGHPCALAPMTAQVSIIGGGAGFGGMKIDDACMLLIMAASSGDAQAYQAATVLMAGRDSDTCRAMYTAGMVSDCVDKKGRSTVKAAPTVTSRNTATTSVSYAKCEKNGNKITFTRKAGTDSAVAKAQCLTSLGY